MLDKNIWNKSKQAVLDTFFPAYCLSCNKPDCWLCDNCLNQISLKNNHLCPLCKKKFTPAGKTCFSCQQNPLIDGVLISSFYKKNNQKTLLANLIHYYKYRFLIELKNPLGEVMRKAFLKSDLELPDFVIPVPLHPRRLRWRNFNQSELLAEYLSKNLTPGFHLKILTNVLIRKKYTLPQAKTKNRRQRIENLKKVFAINKNFKTSLIQNKNILLVDDVITTGTTLFECAKILKKNKVKKVYALVLARQ